MHMFYKYTYYILYMYNTYYTCIIHVLYMYNTCIMVTTVYQPCVCLYSKTPIQGSPGQIENGFAMDWNDLE